MARTREPDPPATLRWTGGALDARPVVTPPPRVRVNSLGRAIALPLEDHTHCAMIEDVTWLCSPVGGALTLAEACTRLGLNRDAVEQQFRRWKVPLPANYRITEDGEAYDTASLTSLAARRSRRYGGNRAAG